MNLNIGVFGTGQLGSRYLQGLTRSKLPMNIFAYDTSEDSLKNAKLRFDEVYTGSLTIQVSYSTSLSNAPKNLDLAILATTANSRLNLALQIQSACCVRNWLFEKVLEQSLSNLDKFDIFTENNQKAWVNTPMYLWPLYKSIRMQDKTSGAINAKFIGFNGLACNAIHYIDLVSRWNNSNISDINLSHLSRNWYKSKRSGFYEIDGEILITFSDSSTLLLLSDEIHRLKGYTASIETSDQTLWDINESIGLAKSSSGNILMGAIPFQSEITAPLIQSIVLDRDCELPSLSESVKQHKPFLGALLEHWNLSRGTFSNVLPIT